MGSSSSKPPRQYPLVTPGFNVPFGQNPNIYLPPHVRTQNPTTTKKRKKSKRNGSVGQEDLAQAYADGWYASRRGAQPYQPGAQPQPPSVAPSAPAAPNMATHRAQTPFTGSNFGIPQQQESQAPQQQFMQSQAQFQEPQVAQQQFQEPSRANPDIAQVLQPLPPANPAVFGPPALPQPSRPLANPLPTPPRDLYEISPYNTLLNLPQTTALLTAAYTQQGGLPPSQSYGRRRGSRSGGGLLRALTGRGRKEEDVHHFVPVFINGQPPPTNSISQPGFGAPAPFADNPAGPVPTMNPPEAPQFPVPQQAFGDAQQTPFTAAPGPAPIRFSGATPEYLAFLNYSRHPIMYRDAEYPSAMHLHEAMKYLPHKPDFAERIRRCPSIGAVHPLSEELKHMSPDAVRSDWGTAYLPLMQEVILNKFQQHPDLRTKLLQTGDAPLIYADEQDTYWGEGPPGRAGLNHLGRILEEVREELRREGGLA
ncbi:hypothetical protein B0H17DRAFT_1056657 [Mycena rosella]|uniref:NADAR domain-containing protein n=1 Tax=Mycena rosella TaxID=1033263 RepID=A0AAD7GHE9_MYCRO|nr:hypothetical protein B0H17DRAFT_1056657 [Mycena rosella]